MQKKESSFTLLEILIVIIIIGILAALGYINYARVQENNLDKEAQSDLRVILTAESLYRMQSTTDSFLQPSPNTNAGINTAFDLSLPTLNCATSNSNCYWEYSIPIATSSAFCAQALRNGNNGRSWCITQQATTSELMNCPCACPCTCTCLTN